MISIGVRAHDFGKNNPEDLFGAIADAGFEGIQLAFPKAIEGVDSFDDVNYQKVAQVERALNKTGLKLAVLGCYLDLSSTDESVRAKNLATSYKMLQVACDLGAHCVASESSYGHIEDSKRDMHFDYLSTMVSQILVKARELKMPYALEPVFYHALNSKELFLKLAHQVGKEGLQVIFDPTNLMDPKYLLDQDSYIKSCLNAFAPYADVVHIKDFIVNSDRSYSPCRLGDGALSVEPLRSYFACCRQSSLWLIREELSVANADYEVAYLKELLGRK